MGKKELTGRIESCAMKPNPRKKGKLANCKSCPKYVEKDKYIKAFIGSTFKWELCLFPLSGRNCESISYLAPPTYSMKVLASVACGFLPEDLFPPRVHSFKTAHVPKKSRLFYVSDEFWLFSVIAFFLRNAIATNPKTSSHVPIVLKNGHTCLFLHSLFVLAELPSSLEIVEYAFFVPSF